MRFTVHATGYPTGGPATSVYFSTGLGFTSLPTDTPASSTFLGRVVQALDIRRDLFSAERMTGKSTTAVGDVVLSNFDGALDYLLAYGFDGREILVYYGAEGSTLTSGYTLVLKGTIEQPEMKRDELRFIVRDRSLVLQGEMQSSRYSGAGGLDGGSDLTGKPRPRLYGQARNVPGVLVDPTKLIYEFSDTAATVAEVRDKGLALGYGLRDWTTLTSQFGTSKIRGVAYGNGVFVAVGNDAKISTSSDGGLTWTARTSNWAVSGDAITAAYYVEATATWLVVGYDTSNASKTVATSTDDGVTWTLRTTAAASAGVIMRSATYAYGLYIVVGDSGVIQTSSNLTTWTSRVSGFGAINIYSVLYDGTNLLATGDGEGISRSTNGTTWALDSGFAYTSTGNYDLSSLSYDPDSGTYAVRTASDVVLVSTDTVNWTARPYATSGIASNYIYALTVVAGLIVAVTSNGKVLYSEDNGASWRAGTLWSGAKAASCIAHGGGRLVAVGDTGKLSISSTNGTYLSTTDLLDDSLEPSPGTFKYYSGSAGTYVRLGSPPAGQITADISSTTDTPTEIIQALLGEAGLSSGDWSAADLAALPTPVLGFWFGMEEQKINDALDLVTRTIGAYWSFDRTGTFRTAVVVAPSSGSSVMTILDANLVGERLDRLAMRDAGLGIPSYEHVVRYSRNYAVQTTDLALIVTDAARAGFARDYYDSTPSTDATVQTKHIMARPRMIETGYTAKADADAEATRLQTLWGVDRNRFSFSLPLTVDNLALDLGQVVTLKSSRFGLSAGVKHLITMVQVDAAKNRINLDVWG